MRIALSEVERTASLVVLEAELPPATTEQRLEYHTRVGAIAAIDGVTAGAFDREHHCVVLDPSDRLRTLRLAVEREGLPTHGLPPGNDIRWWWMQRRSRPQPATWAILRDGVRDAARIEPASGDLALWGHSHLDVAWLWTYEQTRRKAIRTFANALALIEADPSFVFVQSQPQLYAFVKQEDPQLYERVRQAVRSGRFDADVAALWVEPDANLPSGESLLRQMLFANRFALAEFGIEPKIAWLPDSFGFARTLPTLLAHAGIAYFATTKLRWNDTTRFPHAQFRWNGPDGSEVIGALISSYDGSPDARRAEIARTRNEPLIVGYGDGGGGPTETQVRDAAAVGAWQRPRAWFEALDERRAALPVYDDELYLEYHRGVYTTHHDVKAFNAALERALTVAEEQTAWCVAVRAPRDAVERLRGALREAWTIVLRNQFHDVLPGTSIAAVYEDVRDEYAAAAGMVSQVVSASAAMLPRARRAVQAQAVREPLRDGDEYLFDNGLLRARVDARGTIVELAVEGGRNLVAQANLLAAYRDRPQKWEAWNIDAGYERHRLRVDPRDAAIADGTLEVRFVIGSSPATMRIALHDGEPFLRVDLAVDWRERATLLRVENWLAIETDVVRYGAPHGIVTRSARRASAQERARFEVPGQRFATATDARGGLAIFALDTYGWSARTLAGGGLALGHSLLRATSWPDPQADRGEARFSWAFAPYAEASVVELERTWEAFAMEPRVRLFTPAVDGVMVVACKPADDGDGVIVRVRECDGEARALRVRAAGRMREAIAVDGLERPLPNDASIEGEELLATIPGYGIRSFRVRF